MSRGVNLMVALVMILFQLPPSLNVSDHDDEWYPLTPFPFHYHPLSIYLSLLPFCVFSGAFVVTSLCECSLATAAAGCYRSCGRINSMFDFIVICVCILPPPPWPPPPFDPVD